MRKSEVGTEHLRLLGAAANGGPVGEGFEVVTVAPGEAQEFCSVKICSFLAKEGLKAPLNVGTFPRLKPVSRSGEPVEFEEVQHGQLSVLGSKSKDKGGSHATLRFCTLYVKLRTYSFLVGQGGRKVLVDQAPILAGFFPDAGVANRRIDGLSILQFGSDVHGDSGPGDVAVSRDLQFLAGGQ